jgi:hypothetical protein
MVLRRVRARSGVISSRIRDVSLQKVAWLVTVIACLITVVVLIAVGYYGYAATTFCVALAAAINLR